MGIFDRLSTLIRSNISDLIARAENPEKMLNQLIVDMRSQLAKAKQQVAGAIADEKRLAAQVEQEKKSAEDWEKRAVLAVRSEERRGGKEWRSRWAPYHLKKKKTSRWWSKLDKKNENKINREHVQQRM